MWNIVVVDNNGSQTYKYTKTGSGAYSLLDAITQALKGTGTAGGKHNLQNVISVTATII